MSVQAKLAAIPDVKIETGTFKYIQIKVSSKSSEKIIIRGLVEAEYHADIFDEESPKIEALGFDTICIGGGRIKHEPSCKKIVVYGYSVGFGRAEHSITVDKLKPHYPGYNITWSNDGY
ncbi:14 kDa phosphohistidine phosphatase-like [Ciona intestinalis]